MNETTKPQTAYTVDDLQACEPESLQDDPAITVTIDPELDSMGFDRVSVTGPTAAKVIEFVRENWGDEDADWFQTYVVDRVQRSIKPQPTTNDPKDWVVNCLDCTREFKIAVGGFWPSEPRCYDCGSKRHFGGAA